jgi:non-specific serine/threonine protein kinase
MTDALARLSREYANFREVFQWSLDSDQLSIGLRLAGALYRFWLVRGHLAEARQWLEPALMRDRDSPPRIRAIALNAAGVLAGMQHDHSRASAFFQQSLEVWSTLGESAHMADAYLNLGLVAHNVGDLPQAEVQFLRAEELFAEVEDRAGLGRAVGSLARIARENGDLERAIALFERCLELFRDAKDDWGAANALHNIGNVRLARGDPRGAEDFFRQALELRLRLGNVLGIAECLEGFATAAADRRPGQATSLLGAAEAMREQAGAPVPASEQGRYAETLDRLRRRQSDEAFTRNWAVGRALTLDDAVGLALRGTSAAPDEQPADPAQAALQHLTRREREIAELVSLGRSNREIADVLAVTLRTVESHLEHVFRKLTIKSRAELAVWALRHGLGQGPATR